MSYNYKTLGSIIIMLLLICSGIIIKTTLSADGAEDSDGDLIINESNSPYYISASQEYNSIKIKRTGKLIIQKTGSLEVSKLELTTGSVLEICGGSLTLKDDDTIGVDVKLNGTCKYLNITDGAKIQIFGTNGGTALTNSQGGAAIIDICVETGIKLKDSMISVQGGSGGD